MFYRELPRRAHPSELSSRWHQLQAKCDLQRCTSPKVSTGMQLHLFRSPFPFSPPLVWRMLDSLNSLTCGVLAPLSQTPCLYLGRRSYWPGSSYFAPGFSFEVASTNTGSSLEQAFQLRRYSPGSISPPECPRKCVTQCDVFPIPGFQFGTKMPSHSLLTFFLLCHTQQANKGEGKGRRDR